jgi:hypothetical protein
MKHSQLLGPALGATDVNQPAETNRGILPNPLAVVNIFLPRRFSFLGGHWASGNGRCRVRFPEGIRIHPG